MGRGQTGEQFRHQHAARLRPRDEIVLLIDRDHGERGRARQRMAVVGQARRKHAVRELVGNPRRTPTAPIGTYALVSPFAIVITSGTTPQ